MKNKIICVVGLGYVGLPLAIAFSKKNKVIGFDINENKIRSLRRYLDPTKETAKEKIKKSKILFTSDPKHISEADFVIVAVPTPSHKNTSPDLSFVENSSKIVGANLKKGAIVVYESTVYPGVTDDVCLPILEKYSGLICGKDFKIGYSPERINPGDKKHPLTKIRKIVSGMDKDSLKKIAKLYSEVIEAGIYEASSIKVAEAAKVIENTQRDLNIALMNELSFIFNRMGLSTKEVIEAASTKWNFHKYRPGLVGGHCISIDPYYLIHKAKLIGHTPKLIIAARQTNESVARYIARKVMSRMKLHKKDLKNTRVLILGMTFKENVNDMRNSKVVEIIKELKKNNIIVHGHDPLLTDEQVKEEFGIRNTPLKTVKLKYDAIILAVPHNSFKGIHPKLDRLLRNKIIFDVPNFLDKDLLIRNGFIYDSL